MADDFDIRSLRVPVFCPICRGLMKGNRSNITYYDHGCCVNCFIYFIEGSPERLQRWKSGWRPTPEQIEAMRNSLGGG